MSGVATLVDGFGASRDDLRERYRGALLGLATGNALGIPIEGLGRADIAARGGVTEVDPEERNRPWDDDVAQAAILAEALLERDRLTADDLGPRFLRWALDNGRGMGLLTVRVMKELGSGVPPDRAARTVWERSGRQAAGNGAVMRCAPVALRWCRTGEVLVREARASALVTHHDPRCEWSTVAVTAAVAAALAGARPGPQELGDALDGDGAPAAVGEAVRAVDGAGLDDLSLDDEAMGYTLKTMQVGLWSLWADVSLEDGLLAVVNAGGDTDTNGAVAGAVLGARWGAPAVPARWREAIPDPDRLSELADGLLAAAEGGGTPGPTRGP